MPMPMPTRLLPRPSSSSTAEPGHKRGRRRQGACVTGTVTEFGDARYLTELTSTTNVQVCSTGNALPTATNDHPCPSQR